MNTITELQSIPELRLMCPACLEYFKVGDANLFDSRGEFPLQAEKVLGKIKENLKGHQSELSEREKGIFERRKELQEELKRKPEITHSKTAGINFGQIIEKIVPSFKSFPYNQRDCRQLFDPIDYVVFKELSKGGKVDSIIFVDIKTGSSRLNGHQKSIKQVIENGKVSFSVLGGLK